MKQLIITLTFAISGSCFAQTADSVILGAGYANDVYYSLENGEVATVIGTNWDLGFDLSNYGATIRMNRRINTLWLAPTTDFSLVDTTGHASWSQYIDGYESWEQGALNAPANTTDPTDLGWGNYNTVTHQIIGSRVYVIKLDDDSYRKLEIESLIGGVYSFRYANIDGSNEVNETITKSTYTGKNFIYYSLLNEVVVDREPLSANWDLVFTNYVLELAPGYYGAVTGVLTNTTFTNTTIAEVNDVPVANADYTSANFESTSNLIGHDWKTFNMSTFTYTIEDSLCFFVKDENDNIWKLEFTGFVGSSNGKIYFNKDQITFASAEILNTNSISIYPNPANQFIYIANENHEIFQLEIYNISGQLIYQELISASTPINIEMFPNGNYFMKLIDSNNTIQTEKITIQH